jgi:hypothetical protein
LPIRATTRDRRGGLLSMMSRMKAEFEAGALQSELQVQGKAGR